MKALLFVVALLTAPFLLKGQGNIRGKVAEENGEALPGAFIILKGTTIGTITSDHGIFQLKNLEAGEYNLEISFMGFETHSQKVVVENSGTTSLEIEMKAGDIRLADVVVNSNTDRPMNTLSSIDIQLRPTNTSQDILRMVPGLFIAQHAGGGKAEQIFLRGFDIDHGTDINLEVDGLPVNMVSHAHGQGYSDLHFIIPELIHYVDFDKGPYYADKGNFTTAGYADFRTRNVLDKNFAKVEAGLFGVGRAVTGVNLPFHQQSAFSGYAAGEFYRADGYFEKPQGFIRTNLTTKLSAKLNKTTLTLGASYFKSNWRASGQIPERAIANGMITRYGSIDNDEGGETDRMNIYLKHTQEFVNGSFFEQQAYFVNYNFDLYSNFTFYLNDPFNGDEINQRESRNIYGYKGAYNTHGFLFGKELKSEIGVGLRTDDINDLALSHTVDREFMEYEQFGDVMETNLNAYVNQTLSLNEKLKVNGALRIDNFHFTYRDHLINNRTGKQKTVISPKLSFNYTITSSTQVFLRSGYGFHSNDARVVIQESANEILPQAFGLDLGIDTRFNENLFFHAALWHLDLDQEFVYVGDEGIIEPGGKTQRDGLDISIRYAILPWLFMDEDLNFTHAVARNAPKDQNLIPLAPTFSSIGGLTAKMKNGINASLRYRFLGDRSANENNSVIAKGYFLADAILNYTTNKYEVGLSAENIFNTEWNEAQFDTESRMQDETESVSEIHFTPGTPCFIKLKVSVFF